jgi:hypothetical protein
MTARPFVLLLAAGLALSACEQSAEDPATQATPQPTATVVKVIEVPTPDRTPETRAAVEVMQKPTACGAEKLQDYLNLLPTATAKDEIARTLGHGRVRYVPLAQEKAETTESSARVTAGIGPDGRIKEFACG